MSLTRSSLMALVAATVVAGASYVKADVTTDTNLNNVATTLSGQTVSQWGTGSAYYHPEAQVVAGLANAGNVTGSVLYKNAAIAGASYIVTRSTNNYSSNYFGDEAYALAVVGTTFGPASYATTATTFYNTYIGASPGSYYSTQMTAAGGSVDQVVQLAYLTVGAYKLGLQSNTTDYRAALVNVANTYVSDANAGGYSAVAALGAVVWALGSTGGLAPADTHFLTDLQGRYDPTSGGFFSYLVPTNDPGYDAINYPNGYYGAGVFEQQFGIMALNATVGAPILAYTGGGGSINGLVFEDPPTSGNWVVSNTLSPGSGDTYLSGAYLQAVPEPASLGVLLLGTLALAYRRKSR